MKVWGKTNTSRFIGCGVARAAVEGATREELTSEAVHTLLAHSGADRVGVWMEPARVGVGAASAMAEFRGMVADYNGHATPAEWTKLAPEVHLPKELLVDGRTTEQDVNERSKGPVMGALLEMHRVLWVPIEQGGRLRGALLAAVRKKKGAMPRTLLESVSGELALALELDHQQRIARERDADVDTVSRGLAALESSQPLNTVLHELVEDCTRAHGKRSGIGAIFAAIGQVREAEHEQTGAVAPVLETEHAEGSYAAGTARPAVHFLWRSGDPALLRSLEHPPVAEVWRQAVQYRHLAGSDAEIISSQADAAHVVAIPLEAAGESLGVLVAGFRREDASLMTLERLELRAALAAAAIVRQRRNDEAANLVIWQRTVLEANDQAAILLNPYGEIAELTRGAKQLLGVAARLSEADAVQPQRPRNFPELFPFREREHLKNWWRRALAAIQNAENSAPDPPVVELANGTRARLGVIMPPHGGAVAVTLETLQSRPLVAAPERVHTEVGGVIEWLDEGVVLFGPDQEIRAMNSRFAQIAGLTPQERKHIGALDELIARLAKQSVDPDKFAQRWRELAGATDAATREELRMAHPGPRILERAARPVVDSAGNFLGRLEIYRDVTAQRAFQSKLLQTEKLAAIGQMVTGIAHELSNPLTTILGYAQRLLSRKEPAAQPMEATQIFHEAERASAILRQLLLTARESGPERHRVSLNQIVSHTIELQRFSLDTEKVKVEGDLDPVEPFVQADAGQLQQVLMNLIGNARQAIEEHAKAGAIRVRTRHVGDRRVLLEVSDDGPGIPQAVLPRIFDPFFTTKPPGIGTGLGLAVVLGIVREHGGHVRVTSPPGGGATFSIELPAAASAHVPDPEVSIPARQLSERLPSSPPEVAHAGSALAKWAGLRILVVEDEPTVAHLIQDVLKDEGLRVNVILNGREALKRAARERYDLVICDMKMPDVDGQNFYETLIHGKSDLRGRFLFVTGDVLGPHTREFLERNQLPHVAKPFRVEELTEQIQRVLERISPREPSPAHAAKTRVARK